MKKKPKKTAVKPAKRKKRQLPLFKRGSIPRKKKKNSYPGKVIAEESGTPLNGDL